MRLRGQKQLEQLTELVQVAEMMSAGAASPTESIVQQLRSLRDDTAQVFDLDVNTPKPAPVETGDEQQPTPQPTPAAATP